MRIWVLFVYLIFLVLPSEALFGQKGSDYYQILGVSRDASPRAIRKAYRALSKEYHPDKNPSSEAAAKFAEVAEAYEVLSDEKKKNIYNKYGKDGLKRMEESGGDNPMGDFGSMFDSFFGGGGGFPFGDFQQRRRDKADDTRMTLYVTLKQLYDGDTLHIALKRPVICLHADDCLTNRQDCSGPGVKTVTQRLAANYIVQSQTADPTCVDKGRGWTSAGRCPKCPNGLTSSEETFLTAFIEPGMKTGDVLKFDGAGQQSLSLDPGDVVLTLVEENEDDKYIRDGQDNLHTQLFITLEEALVGFDANLPHISGTPINIKRTEPTIDGWVLKISNKGMPKRGSSEFGDLFVRVKVRYPSTQFDSNQRKILNQLFHGMTEWKHLAVPNTIHQEIR